MTIPADSFEDLNIVAFERPPARVPVGATRPSPVARLVDRVSTPRWPNVLIALVAALLAAAAAVAYVGSLSPVYATNAEVLVDQPLAIPPSQAEGVIVKLNLVRDEYAGLANTDLIVTPVARRLGLDPGAVAGSIVVYPTPFNLLLAVGARSASATTAERIAQATAEELVRYVADDQAAHGVPPQDRIVLRVVSPAPPAGRIEPTRKRKITDAAGAAIAALVVVYVGLQLATGRRVR